MAHSDLAGLLHHLERKGVAITKISVKTGIDEGALRTWMADGLEPDPVVASRLRRVCAEEDLTELLVAHGFHAPSYNILADYAANNERGPTGSRYAGLPLPGWATTVLGRRVNFPIGIPACALTGNARWVRFYASNGFDVLTYKTVAARQRPAYDWPNWVFLKGIDEPLSGEADAGYVEGGTDLWPEDPANLSMANSFGIPSPRQDVWKQDVRHAKVALASGQMLLVSVYGNSDLVSTQDEIVREFVLAAVAAAEAGADAVELNLSCPNIHRGKGEIFRDPTLARELCQAVSEAVRPVPVAIKIGYLVGHGLAELVNATADYVGAISAINTVSMEVRDASGRPLFGTERREAGVSGFAIRSLAERVLRELVEIKVSGGHAFDIISIGGVTTPQDALDRLEHGATAVQVCTAALFNPDLAREARQVAHDRGTGAYGFWQELRAKIVTELEQQPCSFSDLVEKLRSEFCRDSQVVRQLSPVVAELVTEGIVAERGGAFVLARSWQERAADRTERTRDPSS